MLIDPRRSPILALVIVVAIATACGPSSSAPLELRPVVAENVHRLEAAIGPERELAKPDTELVDRTRALVNSVASQRGAFRESFAGQAQELGDAIVPLLSGWIGNHDQSYEARRAAIQLLAALDTPRAEHALVYHVSQNPEVWVRSNCAWRLGDTHQDQCMVALLEAALDERDGEVKTSIDHALTAFGCYALASPSQAGFDPEVLRRWRYGDPEGKLPVHAPSPRLQLDVWQAIASLSATDPKVRGRTITVLGELPGFAAEMLSTALRDANADIRRGAASALAAMEMRAASAGPTLHESLLHDSAVTTEAIEALGAVHQEKAADDVSAYMASSHPLEQRLAAARALGRLTVARTLPALESAVKAGEPDALRTTAAMALVPFGREREAFTVLVDAFEKSTTESAVVESTFESWLRMRASQGDEHAQKALKQWTDPSATRESRVKLLREEVLPYLK